MINWFTRFRFRTYRSRPQRQGLRLLGMGLFGAVLFFLTIVWTMVRAGWGREPRNHLAIAAFLATASSNPAMSGKHSLFAMMIILMLAFRRETVDAWGRARTLRWEEERRRQKGHQDRRISNIRRQPPTQPSKANEKRGSRKHAQQAGENMKVNHESREKNRRLDRRP